MKKKFLLAATVFVATSLISIQSVAKDKYVNFFKGVPQKENKNNYFTESSSNNKIFDSYKTPSFKHWSISGEAFSLNDKIPSSLKKLRLGYDLTLQYNLNPNLYASANAKYGNYHSIGWGSTIGLQASSGMFRPYIEGVYEAIPQQSKKWDYHIGYNIGVNLNVAKWIIPYLEFNNLFQNDKEGFSTGITVPVSKSFLLKAGYQYITHYKFNSMNFELIYKL